ncbi:MAG: mitochondrial 54S ribosomal protein mrpl1 [Chrysothrix sp. TS-e1954]|nr:MAG: mitochondrial 54S ribosomal protein mrpl1 [Chrysothrix sp. TS-e1954]
MAGRGCCRSALSLSSRPALPTSCLRPPKLPIQRTARTFSHTTRRCKKKKAEYHYEDLKQAEKFTLVDAMRYLRAFEVGRSPSAKYELAVRMRTLKSGPVIRNRFRPPHPVNTDIKVCVICPPDSQQAKAVLEAGASMVGEEEIFEHIRTGKMAFDRLLCANESLGKLGKAQLGRILGPRGLMPSAKTGTVAKDVSKLVRDINGTSEYRERQGVVRLAIGKLGFTPEQLQKNVRSFMATLKSDCAKFQGSFNKEVHEVVLSSTGGPGFTLSGEYRNAESIPVSALSV